MMRTLRNIIALLLCGILLYNTMGYMVVFSSMQMLLRQQTFAKLSTVPDTALTVFTILKTDKVLVLKGRRMPEIKVDGKMYDIVRQKDNGKSITYFCLRDRKEEQLILKAGLAGDRSKRNSPLSKTSSLILDQIIKTALLTEKKSFKEYPIIELLFDAKCHIYSGPILAVPAHPPQQFS